MSYLYIYITIGLLLALWDFRKYIKLAFWHIRFWNVEGYAAIITYGPKPSVDLLSMPGYIRERNYFIVAIFILIWPIKIIFFTPRLNAFIRNIRAGRITFIPRKKSVTKKFTLDEPLKGYENIVNHFSLGTDKICWLVFLIEGRDIIIHNGSVNFDETLEDIHCPTGEKYSLYRISTPEKLNDETIWNVEESNCSFNVRMSGHGSEDKYQENPDGKIIHLKQVNNWLS
jgi:hypothetical protein